MQSTSLSTDPRTRSVESVMHALMSVGRLMRRSPGETLDPGTFWMLKTITAHGAMRVTDLAQYANLDTSTVSRHVAQLHRTGLIERTPDPDDRRAQRVELSQAGRDQLDAAVRSRIALLEEGLGGWEPEELDDLGRLLTRLVGDLDTLTHGLNQQLNQDLEKA
jgi:DNA-binding MarR family transcriptional regulator